MWDIHYDGEDRRWHPGLFNGQAHEFRQTGGVTTPQFLMLSFVPDGTGRVLIRRSKTDQAVEGNTANLSRETVRHLSVWLERAHIKEGALFRRLVGRQLIGERLNVVAVAQAIARVVAFIGIPPTEPSQISGHRVRVGARRTYLLST